MQNDPADLDEHRDTSAQKATEICRQRLQALQADQVALRRRQEEPKKPSHGRSDGDLAGGCGQGAVSLVQLFAAAPEVKDPGPKELTAHALDEIGRS